MSPTRNWMNVERRIARYFGSDREKSKLSSDRKKSCDFITPDGGQGEVKLRKEWPSAAQILKWWNTLEKKAQVSGRYPILCIQVGGARGFWYAKGNCLIHATPEFTHSTWETP